MIQITSTNNRLIKNIKSLYRKKGRQKHNSFIVEGIKIIEEAIENDYPIKHIVYTDYLLENEEGKALFSKIEKLNNLVNVPENIFKEISDTENPQGIIGITNIVPRDIKEIYDLENKRLLFLDGLQDPGNMGTIIRTADAFSMGGIIIREGSVDPYNPKVIRATMGSIFRVPLYFTDGIEELKNLKSKGVNIYSTSLDGSIAIYKADFMEEFILSIGNESRGVSKEVLSLSNKLIKIPMTGKTESLNAAVAASIIMYEAMKGRIG
ncbi:MAG TPA: RNA methyltransferase [Tissierellaceae bacterium]|nr:RNA methyltransferase [Tissierellaceae bacterium]